MTDRYVGLTVSLDKDIREDDAESLINAIKMIKGVSGVTPEKVSVSDYSAKVKYRDKCLAEINKVFNEE